MLVYVLLHSWCCIHPLHVHDDGDEQYPVLKPLTKQKWKHAPWLHLFSKVLIPFSNLRMAWSVRSPMDFNAIINTEPIHSSFFSILPKNLPSSSWARFPEGEATALLTHRAANNTIPKIHNNLKFILTFVSNFFKLIQSIQCLESKLIYLDLAGLFIFCRLLSVVMKIWNELMNSHKRRKFID